MKKWQKTGLLIVWCIIIAGCFYFRKELTTEQILNPEIYWQHSL